MPCAGGIVLLVTAMPGSYQALQGRAPGSQPAIRLRLWAGEFASNRRGANAA